jgi:hypothetical protein
LEQLRSKSSLSGAGKISEERERERGRECVCRDDKRGKERCKTSKRTLKNNIELKYDAKNKPKIEET